MTARKQELYNVIETLPEELSNKVIEYIEYLKYSMITSKAPKNLIVKDKKDLREKLEEGIKDTENGIGLSKAYTNLDEMWKDLEKED
jgi:sugar-specific transcriptional regulator TrmB